MAELSPADNDSIVGRVRSASISIMNVNPQLGMWQAAGTAIAHAPSLTELRDPDSGGDNIAFTAQGHSARHAVQEPRGDLALVRPAPSRRASALSSAEDWRPGFRSVFGDKPENIRESGEQPAPPPPAETSDKARLGTREGLRAGAGQQLGRRQSLHEKHMGKEKAPWKTTINNGLKAFWKFFLTPSGFIITIYGLNIVAWGVSVHLQNRQPLPHPSPKTAILTLLSPPQAMLFFLLLKAAPAMNHPSASDHNSPRKKWIEICSQILNGLFCVTGFGLAPWRFRDLYLYVRAANFRSREAMMKLAAQNRSWFRPPAWATAEADDDKAPPETFTGQAAPPTALWKLGLTIWMMVLNTLLQAVLCYFMWGYNRHDRPEWATGTFIGLGCGVAMLAGLVSWWEGRKVKKIEGPRVKVVQEV
ncbi:hypothetical protein LX32DRAFT_186639 [Colletotrichum zoysiae]|uniref:Alpha-L-rhamnosidase C n=1 Tax=Colletotrichum zoysiae TaxID=1216348 RepID=A0AAD9LVG5_9PEZI|nr:hypothetical protein LX32DRAFT_186639 [Colletotrichum zoysiae]